jgi:Ca2+-binding EF-hand superfamily protein
LHVCHDNTETGMVSIASLKHRMKLAGETLTNEQWRQLTQLANVDATTGLFAYQPLIEKLRSNRPQAF